MLCTKKFLDVIKLEWSTPCLNSSCGLAFGTHLLLTAKHNTDATLKADHRTRWSVTMRNLKAILLGIISLHISRTMLSLFGCWSEYKEWIDKALLVHAVHAILLIWYVCPYAQVGALPNLNIGNVGGKPGGAPRINSPAHDIWSGMLKKGDLPGSRLNRLK